MSIAVNTVVSSIVVAATLAGTAGVATADLLPADLLAPGDGQAVTDTTTGFRWARLTATLNVSVDTMLTRLAPGGDLEGYVYATPAQIADLFRGAGAVSIPSTDFFPNNPGNLAACQTLLSVMGTTMLINGGPDGPGRAYGLGFNSLTVDLGRGTSTIMIDGFSSGGQPPFMAYLSPYDGSAVTHVAFEGMGHFLVMIPSPSAAATLAFGGLVTLRRRR